MKEIKPFPHWKSYLFIRKLQEEAEKELKGEVKVRYNRFSRRAYTIPPNKIFLPFVEPLDLEDLRTLLKHEILHIKESGRITLDTEDAGYLASLNILEDNYINRFIDINKLKTVYKKLESPPVGIIVLLREEEALIVIKELKKQKLFKEEYSNEHILDVFKKAIKKRESYSNLQEFYEYEKTFLREEYFPLFNNNELLTEVGDGPCDYDDFFTQPNFELKREFTKILRNLISVSTETETVKNFSGRRTNERFLYDYLEIKPFKEKRSIININNPKITVIVDMSGSMEGEPVAIAKALVMSILETFSNSVAVFHNQYYTRFVKTPEAVVRLPETGDESFDKLPERIDEDSLKSDILLIITDLNISEKELKGLNEVIGMSSAKAKYCLCVDRKYFDSNVKAKKFLVTNKEEFLKAIKRIVTISRNL